MAVVKAQVASPRKIVLTVTLTLVGQCVGGFVDRLKLKNSDAWQWKWMRKSTREPRAN
jgi:hypothetical protein